MEIKRQVTTYGYKIEPKPDGGFIARSIDPSVPSIEAPTREELQKQIEEKLASALSLSLGGLTLPFGLGKKLNLQIKPEANFALHAGSENTAGVGSSPEQVQHAVEEIANIVGKNFPELKAALEAKIQNVESQSGKPLDVNGAQVKITVTRNVGGSLLGIGSKKNDTGKVIDGQANFSDSPITPEAGGMGRFWTLLFFALILTGIAYFFLHR